MTIVEVAAWIIVLVFSVRMIFTLSPTKREMIIEILEEVRKNSKLIDRVKKELENI